MKAKFIFLSLLFPLFFNHPLSAQGKNNRLLFVANLNGEQEVPAVVTDARGIATFLFSEDLSTISVHGVFSGLSGPITGCHVHDGVEGVTGPVFTNFSSNLDGHSLRAEIPVPTDFLSKGLKKALYLNVHTAANPAGEIRGQLALMNDVQYVATLNGLEEVPPVLTTATGVFRLTYSPGSSKASYFASYNGLSGAPSAAHIHNGATGVSGPVVVGLSAGGTGTYSGELDLSALPSDFLQKLEDGQLYVNVHTAANPAGEIRGQLRSLGPITFEATLNGDQETPPVTTSAIGSAVATLNATLDTLTYFVSATGLSPSAAHFHLAPPGTAGGVIAPLGATPAPNFYTGAVALNSSQVGSLFAGDIYVNVHTAANPAGEIRGQMEPNLRRVFAFDLCGEQEVPSNSSAGQGVATVTINRLNTHLDYFFVADGLSGPASAAHIHDAAFGVNGPVLFPLNTPNPVSSGQFQITGNDATKLESGGTYLNVHTAMHPGGEIRGQVRRMLSCSENVGVSEPLISEISVSPNPSSAQTEIRMYVNESFDGQLLLTDLTGKIVHRRNYSFEAGSSAMVLTLDLSALPSGLYMAQIRSQTHGFVNTFKLVRR